MTNGLVVMTPTSVATTGASSTATINVDGSVTFGLCETLSLNGVFTSDYDNYMVTMRLNSAAGTNIQGRLRKGSTDVTTGYVFQTLTASSTSVSGARYSATSWDIADVYATQRAGATIYFYGPYLFQPTAFRTLGANDYISAAIFEHAGTHSASSSCDGFTFNPNSATTFTGLVTVFGFNQ